MALTPPEEVPPSSYTKKEKEWAMAEGATLTEKGWWMMPDGHIFVPTATGGHLVKGYHQLTHLRKTALEALLKKHYYISQLPALCRATSERCITCATNNARSAPRPPPGVQRMGATLFKDLEVDFTDVQPSRGFRCFLVIVCTYSGWVEAFLTRMEHSREVAKVLLGEIVPRFGLP